ncbi:histone deacetylase family protein [Thioclava nitratireducens]|uniref:histone deacetylase family protein n=1 Tax=Thioclava nitratireducens TaxID=1915078 RepID=UPI00247FBD6F|nr:histone deacetylase family protein [Thioclava nitratireducens]WGT50512.1 histone deacetylase family protein [Thioclava nitratireducens]
MRTFVTITHEDCLAHDTGPTHRERPWRLETVRGLIDEMELPVIEAREASDEDLLLGHDAAYLEALEEVFAREEHADLDSDTHVSPGSRRASRLGAGGALQAVDLVLTGEAERVFVATRPPGHHATRTRAMGFCIYGNTGLAALHALERHGLSRVAVLDFDVHHGNGTQDILWDEPRSLFISSHQEPKSLWPGTGARSETGAHDNVLNLPLASGSGASEMKVAWEDGLARLEAFNPELIIVSAGFDAHREDDISGLLWTAGDYWWLTSAIRGVARRCCDGRLVSCLEGGYNPTALAEGAAAHLEALAQ